MLLLLGIGQIGLRDYGIIARAQQIKMRDMTKTADEIEQAIEAFVRGFCAGRSVTHPYEHARVGKLWVMRDGPRKNAKNYRKEEWVAYGVQPREVEAVARGETRGRFWVCAVRGMEETDDRLKAAYKELGYLLLATESLFVHRLKRVPRVVIDRGTAGRVSRGTRGAAITIEQVRTAEMAVRFGKATRTRPIRAEDLADDAPFRQYVALEGGELVGWVRSVAAGEATWCANMYVRPTHRRRGIGRALIARMLRDDRAAGATQSVLLASHAGALLYPKVGYEQIGMLLIFAPKK
jgi:predicted N-acetyltransferase YhbS